MAAAAHDGLARALYPSHTPFDGDLVFGVSTCARPLQGDAFAARLLIEHAAAHCLARAVARGLHAARPVPGDVLPCWSQSRGAMS
jgi:D-aminopeptidase